MLLTRHYIINLAFKNIYNLCLSHEIKWSFDDSAVLLGIFYASGEGFKIIKF
jgi:hypothetical protein